MKTNRQLTAWQRSHEKHVTAWLYPVLGWIPFNKEAYDVAKVVLAKRLAILDAHLASNEWIVGKRVTVANIVIFCGLILPFNHLFAP